MLDFCDVEDKVPGLGWFTGTVLSKWEWIEGFFNASSLTCSGIKGFVKTRILSTFKGVNNKSNSSRPFSDCGFREGLGKNADSGISKVSGSLNLSDEVETRFLLVSLNNSSGFETPGFSGDEGFPRVPIFLEATVTAQKVIECSLNPDLLILLTLQNQFQNIIHPGKILLFLYPSPATAPEDVIPKVGPRLQGIQA